MIEARGSLTSKLALPVATGTAFRTSAGRAVELEDTIFAVSSPAGASLRAAVRISGPDAVRIAPELFVPANGANAPESAWLSRGFCATRGSFVLEGGRRSISCWAFFLKGPRSYTAEDVVEFHLPGSPALLALVLEELERRGLRQAQPGEFTMRAFLRGRIDLTQAEAVAALLEAGTREELELAARTVLGELRQELGFVRGALVELCADVEACMDFVEEEIRFVSAPQAGARADELRMRIRQLLERTAGTAVCREEPVVVLCGPVNAGKSSLLRRLAEGSRVIVSDQPGTTRDVVIAEGFVEGLRVRWVDTAGFFPGPIGRKGTALENMAIAQTEQAIDTASVVVWVEDGSTQPPSADSSPFGMPEGEPGKPASRPAKPTIVVVNKADLGLSEAWQTRLADASAEPRVLVSAKAGQGIGELTRAVARSLLGDSAAVAIGGFTVNQLQRGALDRAGSALERAAAGFREGLGFECCTLELREALSALGEVTGEVATDEILGSIFSRFCVGK